MISRKSPVSFGVLLAFGPKALKKLVLLLSSYVIFIKTLLASNRLSVNTETYGPHSIFSSFTNI